jgi:hypothetical protein
MRLEYIGHPLGQLDSAKCQPYRVLNFFRGHNSDRRQIRCRGNFHGN